MSVVRLTLFLALLVTAACSGPKEQTLKVGFVPSENMSEVLKKAQPIVDLLHKKLNVPVQPFVATDYSGVVEALRSGKLDVAFLNPAAYVMARDEADVRVILKSVRHGTPYFYAAIITRADSGITKLTDLKDRSFVFGDPLSTSGYVFPKKMFKAVGLDPARDFKQVTHAGGHDATVLAVLNRKADAGATFSNNTQGNDGAWTLYLKSPEKQKKIRVVAYSEPIPADNLCVSGSLAPETVKQIESIFLELGKTPEGKKWLSDLYKIDGFEKATDDDYKSVRDAFNEAGIGLKKHWQ